MIIVASVTRDAIRPAFALENIFLVFVGATDGNTLS
jgi:hypothetical protein